jgi:MoaA/NifB/PqqE/SkfB family radical SAM enzyme
MLAGAALVARELQLEHSTKLGSVLFHGNSMLPFLRDGDELIVQPVAWESIRVGDIVTYRLDDRFPTCRVARRDGDKLVLRADNRPASFQVWRQDVLGQVVSRTRGGRILRATDWEWRAATLARLGRHRLSGGMSRVRRRLRWARTRVRKRWLRLRHGYRELPPAIQFNVARPCNLHCRMCPYLELHSDESRARYMSVETFEKLLPVVPLLDRVHFSGSGEPTFNKDLTRFMRMVRERHPNKRIDLTTNGTRLTESLARELIDLPLYQVHVSFDGASPETVRAIRRGVDYSRVMANLRALDEQKRRLGRIHPIVMVNYMTGYGTYREIVDFVRLAKEVGVREIQLLEMQPACAEDFSDNLLNNLERDRGKALREAVKLAESYGIQIHLPITQRNACYYPTIPHIGEDGEVYACCFLDYDGRQLYSEGRVVQMPGISFGNAARSGFKQVWESEAFVELRTRDARGDFPEYCRACYNARIHTSEKVREVFGLK